MKKLLSLFLAFVIALGLLPTGVFAADSVEDALGEVNIYNGDYELGYLSINGTVRKQIYTYFLYEANDGTTKEAPAYCVNPNQYGVPQTVGPGESIKYLAEEKSSDPKVVGIISNGYPHRSLGELGLDNKYQAYYATKMALWCYLLPNWSINNLKVAPGLTGAELDRGNRILAAAKDIYQRGTTYNYMLDPRMTVTADKSTAYPVTIDGQEYKQQVFTVWSETWVYDYDVSVAFSDPSQVPEGTKIVDMDNNEITAVTTEPTGDGYSGQFKILYPLESVTGQTGSVQLSLSAPVAQYAAMYAVCQEKDQYGNLQNYICDLDNNVQLDVAAISNYADSPEDDPPDTGLKIIKLEAGTETPLEGAIFSVTGPDGEPIGSFSTNAEGEILIPLTLSGLYTVTEEIPSRYHLLPEEDTQQVTVRYGETAEVTFWNEPYGELRVVKVDADTGDELYGARIQIKHIESGATYTGTTDTGGSYTFTELKPGAYEIVELTAPEGWERDPQTYTTTVVTGDCVEYTIKNEALPGLKIIKYDRESHETIPGVTFRIWRDGELLGDYETDALGEIILTNCTPGTYLVQEVDTGDSGHLVDSTPQEIELSAGDGIKPLYFFNDRKPGIYLVKVDSADPSKVIPNAKFSIEAVDGSFGPAEFVTDENGEIDLSELEPGAYVVTELECPGYIIDQAQRIIQLEANQTAEFVFTNTTKPSLHLVKLSADGSPLAGVTFRIAKIEDGTHYLDRTTNEQGEILISDLEPGVYSIKETSTVADHLIDPVEHHVELFAGKTSTIILENQKRPSLTIQKRDSVTGQPLAGAQFRVTTASGCEVGLDGVIGDSTLTQAGIFETDANGEIRISNLTPGAYILTELRAPEGYTIDNPSTNVVIGEGGDTQTVVITNTPKGGLLIKKMDSVTKEPLSDVTFKVTTADGAVVGTSNGEYRTDSNGYISIPGLEAGTYIVQEIQAKSGYLLDDTPKTITVKDHQTYTLEVFNQPKGGLVINKLDSVTHEPLEGVEFTITEADGTVVDDNGGMTSSMGLYRTDENGQIILDGLVGTFVITETKTIEGYIIHEETRTQTVVINPNDTQTITVYNDPIGGVELVKVNSADKTQRIPNVTFEIREMDGGLVDTVTTDRNGRVFLPLEDGAYYAVEIESAEGFKLDDTPVYFTVENGKTTTLQVENEAVSGILIHKTSSTTGEGIYGVTFLLYDDTNTPIGQYTSDNEGYVWIEDLPAGRYYLRELENEGYVLDTEKKTVYVKSGETTEVEWQNTPILGQIQIIKKSANDNPINGLPAGTLLEGAVFEIYDKAGNVVDTIRSDSRGRAVSKLLPLGRYTVREVTAPDYYAVNPTVMNAYLEYEGQIVTFEVENDSVATGVNIKKTGPAQVISGQPIQYTLTGIGNTSTVPLTSFYWRDALPAQVTLTRIVTGTYNQQLAYKIVYKTNLSGDTYLTLADNLSTTQNYVLDASSTALGLAANEKVTEFMVVFGAVKAGFAQVETPYVHGTVAQGLANNSSFVNVADVGGLYNGQWIMGVSRWVTSVYAKPEPLPRTGY